MNNARREMLKQAIAVLEEAEKQISIALEQEEDCLGNMPENLETSEKYEKMEETVEMLEEAIECIDSAKDCVTQAIE